MHPAATLICSRPRAARRHSMRTLLNVPGRPSVTTGASPASSAARENAFLHPAMRFRESLARGRRRSSHHTTHDANGVARWQDAPSTKREGASPPRRWTLRKLRFF